MWEKNMYYIGNDSIFFKNICKLPEHATKTHWSNWFRPFCQYTHEMDLLYEKDKPTAILLIKGMFTKYWTRRRIRSLLDPTTLPDTPDRSPNHSNHLVRDSASLDNSNYYEESDSLGRDSDNFYVFDITNTELNEVHIHQKCQNVLQLVRNREIYGNSKIRKYVTYSS